MSNINLSTTQQATLTLIPEDILGNVTPAATITGTPLWNTSNVNVASLVVASNGLSALTFGTGAGTASISVIANAGTVAAPVQISGSISIYVTQAPAAQLVISASNITIQ